MLPIASPADHDIEMGFSRTHGEGNFVFGGMEKEIVIFTVMLG
jgi:hypothetical protein